jgi:hypothetical protein
MAKRSCGDFFVISVKWLGIFFVILELFVDCALITKKPSGLSAKWWGFSGFRLSFE